MFKGRRRFRGDEKWDIFQIIPRVKIEKMPDQVRHDGVQDDEMPDQVRHDEMLNQVQHDGIQHDLITERGWDDEILKQVQDDGIAGRARNDGRREWRGGSCRSNGGRGDS